MHTHHDRTSDERFKKVEERTGTGYARCSGVTYENVRYAITRFQGMTRAGLPVPGVHRLDGQLDFADSRAREGLVGRQLALHLEDGSVFDLELLDADGRVVAHGHGPGRCMCC
jgi:hypothetical protein